MADSAARTWRPGRPAHILLVEDSPTDAMMVREILAQATVPSALHVVEDGLEALAFLRKENGYGDAPRPDLILLDLKLPRKNGQEVLAEIKSDERLRTIPVVVLTSSHEQSDVLDAYRHYANSYVTKPVDYARFAEAVRLIERFWLELATLAERD
ncbi:chemotaxis protein CheY [Sulfurifustis variabilis]|uniref:Chemotaxis protein CheY n=1 Tax=Sulfurifustis variabilis TaxID=1675686 RepID=A0A1B4V3T8_9GAMM|nr:response regulator [Sulfurifustis variabilis]BAU47172.1 chemotaxis protein CheY [Sulfurifustis variabilis]